jgi:hypothetical protein
MSDQYWRKGAKSKRTDFGFLPTTQHLLQLGHPLGTFLHAKAMV